MRAALAAAALLLFTTPTKAESAAEYFSKDRKVENVSTRTTTQKAQTPSVGRAKEVIAKEVKKTLGSSWVSVALDQARRESGFRPNAIGIQLGKRHGYQRARGIFQVLPSTARGLGFDPRFLTDLEYGAKVGVAYMGKCIEAGVKTSAQMNQCFLHGYHGWGKRNAKKTGNNRRAS